MGLDRRNGREELPCDLFVGEPRGDERGDATLRHGQNAILSRARADASQLLLGALSQARPPYPRTAFAASTLTAARRRSPSLRSAPATSRARPRSSGNPAAAKPAADSSADTSAAFASPCASRSSARQRSAAGVAHRCWSATAALEWPAPPRPLPGDRARRAPRPHPVEREQTRARARRLPPARQQAEQLVRADELAERELEEASPPVRDRLLLDAVAALQGDRSSTSWRQSSSRPRIAATSARMVSTCAKPHASPPSRKISAGSSTWRSAASRSPARQSTSASLSSTKAPLLAMPRRRLELLLEQIPCSPEIAARCGARPARSAKSLRHLRRIGIERDRARHRVRIRSSV